MVSIPTSSVMVLVKKSFHDKSACYLSNDHDYYSRAKMVLSSIRIYIICDNPACSHAKCACIPHRLLTWRRMLSYYFWCCAFCDHQRALLFKTGMLQAWRPVKLVLHSINTCVYIAIGDSDRLFRSNPLLCSHPVLELGRTRICEQPYSVAQIYAGIALVVLSCQRSQRVCPGHLMSGSLAQSRSAHLNRPGPRCRAIKA
jgi:hypothetical protein